jgi:hypothetical protein
MTTTEKIFIQVGQEVIELTGTNKTAFIADLEKQAAEAKTAITAAEAKATTRASALAKLAELGLTQEEIAAL